MTRRDRQRMTAVIGIMAALGCSAGLSETNREGQAISASNEPAAVVVTATRIPHALSDVGVSASVISREQLDETRAQNVGEVFGEVSGARVNNYGTMGSESKITMRGSTDRQVLVMEDGRPLTVPAVGDADLSMYPIDDVERIEIMRGPASVLYGANALAGVVNIVTRDIPEKPRTEASAAYGTFDTSIFRVSNGSKIGDAGYLVTASRNTSDGDRENSECDGYHASGKMSYDLDRESKLIFASGYAQQEKGLPGSTNWPSPNCSQDDEAYWFDATHTLGFGKNSCLTSKAFLNHSWQEYEDPDIFADDISRNRQLGLDVQRTLPMGDRHLLIAGVFLEGDSVNINDINGASRIGGERSLTTAAGYVQDEMSLLDSLVITPGLRCDNQSEYGTELSPKLSGLYRLAEQTSLKASVGRGFRAPSVDDLYWRDAYSIGNPDLKPEESIGYDLGLRQEFGAKNMFQVTAFRSDVDNLITWADASGNGIWEALNVDKARLQGMETEVNYWFTKQLSSTVTYTFLDTRDTGDEYNDKHLANKPQHLGGCRLQYQCERGPKVTLGAEYTAAVYSDRANTSKNGDYALMDAGVSQPVAQGVEIFVNGKNLLDKDYEIVKGYPMPGTTVMGGVKAVF